VSSPRSRRRACINRRRNGGPSISANGRYVAFFSDATNLVPHDTNGVGDIFVRDLRTGRAERVSVLSSGGQFARETEAPVISADGCCVAFVVQQPHTLSLSVRLFR
jgi:Tol biopolymer transport system component